MNPVGVEAQINPQEVLATLGYVKTSEPQRVRGGWGTLLWRFKTPDGREHALRIYHLPPGHQQKIAWRERIALETCAKAGLSVPRIEKVGEVEGLPALVLSWCPGFTLMSFIERKPWFIWRWGRLLGRTQAQVHAVKPPAEFAAKAPNDWVLRVTDKYAALADYLLSLNPSTGSLIHMDFHPLNLISNGTTITGIIDWTGAAAGDPRADLARTEITLLTAPIPPGPLRSLLKFIRKVFLRAWRSGYKEVSGSMPNYRSFKAWAGATLLAEMEFIIDRGDMWATEQEIETFCGSLHRLIDIWAREAGIRQK